MFSAPGQTSARASPALWLFLLAFAVRLLVLVRFSGSLHFLPEGDDMKFYSDWALRIAQGQWTDHKAFYGLPGYPYCLALFFKLASGVAKPEFFISVAVGVLQSLADAAVAVLLFRLAELTFHSASRPREASLLSFGPRLVGISAALAWTFFTPAQTFSVILMPTVWLVLAFWFCVWCAVRIEVSSWWNPWVGLGLLVGFIAMLVATILFAVPLLLAAIFRSVARPAPLRARLPQIAAAILALFCGIGAGAAPAWIHNYFIAREPVMLSAHSGINFWIGNNPVATGYPKMPPGIRATQEGLLRDSVTLAERAAGKNLTRAEISRFWSAKANAYIRENPGAWLRLMAAKLRNFWNAYQYDDLSIIKLLRDDGVLPPGLRFGVVAAFGLAGMLPCVWRFPRARWIAAAVLLHMCALMPVFVTERYRMAAAPGLILLGAGGLFILWENLARARWLPALSQSLGSIAAAWFVSIPQSDIGLWSLDHYKAGIRATAAGDFSRAQRNLETAFAYVPNNADINFALGNLWLEKSSRAANDERAKAGERARAKIFYRRALDLNPQHAGTLNNLGGMAIEEKRWPLAERFFSEAIAAEPEDAKRYYLLARVQLEQGKTDAARASLATAVQMRPAQKEFRELREKLTPSAAAPPLSPAQTPPSPAP